MGRCWYLIMWGQLQVNRGERDRNQKHWQAWDTYHQNKIIYITYVIYRVFSRLSMCFLELLFAVPTSAHSVWKAQSANMSAERKQAALWGPFASRVFSDNNNFTHSQPSQRRGRLSGGRRQNSRGSRGTRGWGAQGRAASAASTDKPLGQL